MKIVTIAATALIATSATAIAGGHNPGEARGMAGFLAGGGGGNESVAKDLLGITENGGVARFVSQKGAGKGGNGGWGNTGSLFTGPDGPNVVDGGLVADDLSVSGKK